MLKQLALSLALLAALSQINGAKAGNIKNNDTGSLPRLQIMRDSLIPGIHTGALKIPVMPDRKSLGLDTAGLKALIPGTGLKGASLIPGKNLLVMDTASLTGATRALRNPDLRGYLKTKIGPAEQSLLKGFDTSQDSTKLWQYFTQKSNAGKSLLSGFINPDAFLKYAPPANKLKGLGAQVIWDDNPPLPFQTKVLLQGGDMVTLGGIPVDINYNNLASFGGGTQDYITGGLFKVNFNREQYLQQLNAKLNTYYDLRKFFLKDMDLESAMRSYVDKRLAGIRTGIDSLYGNGLSGVLPTGMSMDQLVQLDTTQILQLFKGNDPFEAIKAQAINKAGIAGDSVMLQQQAKQAAIEKVLALKRDLESGQPAREQLARFDKVKDQLSAFINTDESRIRHAKELFPLSGLQRFFLRVKDLNIGAFNTDASASSISGLFMKGAGGSFLNKGKMLMLGIGSRTDGQGMKDAFLENNASAGSYFMQFARLGKGDLEEDHTHLTALNANTKNNERHQVNQQFAARNIFVGTLSKQLTLGEYGTINGEFSKSNTEFANAGSGSGGYAMSQKAAAMSFFNDFWQTVSLGLRYTGEVRELSMSQGAYVSYAGMGYNNPGTPFGTRGSWQYGLNVRRRWKFHKMTTAFRTDIRDIQTSFDAGWKSFQYSGDVQFRVKRNWSLNARMMRSSMKSSGNNAGDGFITRQASLTSQLSGYIGSMPSSNLIVAGLQQMKLTSATLPLNSVLANVNIAENLVINGHVLSLNMFYNYDLKQNAVYGNMLNMDAGWSYMLFKTLNCNSGITFLDNHNMVTQLGVKQSMSVELIPGVNAAVYVDTRKNLYSSPLNYLFGTFRTEFSLQYLIN
ncbi:hypothetical protein [uncultured Chitinophaga sp.]|uniref:hypothetical protein n=1 Tax=uncultured Chitinophaga sp. TaxID=339340 RepID=UPI0025F5232B|nr:hypothetical protein [uncultured Chitinophaga sp.]